MKQQTELVVSYLALRQMIGWVSLLMPIAIRVGAYAFEGVHSTHTISAYYYTGMRDVLVSTLVLAGAFLCCYRTPARADNIVAMTTGLAAMGIALFPMDPLYAQPILDQFPSTLQKVCYASHGILGFHIYFGTCFFLLSFYLVFFRFSAFTPRMPTRQKLIRNRIYKICGLLMLVALLAIGVLYVANPGDPAIFWPEAVFVSTYSAAWLVKGQVVLKDPKDTMDRREDDVLAGAH
jgi:hypothetical protein